MLVKRKLGKILKTNLEVKFKKKHTINKNILVNYNVE